MLDSKSFGEKIFNRFPNTYIREDYYQNDALRRYIETTNRGGFSKIIEDTNGLRNLIDPTQTKSKVIPLLFKQYGLEIFNGIQESYLRTVLQSVGNLWEMKGSINIIEYLTASLTGYTVDVTTLEKDGNIDTEVHINMDSQKEDNFLDTVQLSRLLENFIPFYCDIFIYYSYYFSDKINFIIGESRLDNLTISQKENYEMGVIESEFYSVTSYFNDNGDFNYNTMEKQNSLIGINLNSTLGSTFITNAFNTYDKVTQKGVTKYYVTGNSGELILV